MEKLKPKIFTTMKNYSKEQFIKDVISGIIVAIIALPLSIALALASGVTPERGIYTAIIAGFIVSFLGGSRVHRGLCHHRCRHCCKERNGGSLCGNHYGWNSFDSDGTVSYGNPD